LFFSGLENTPVFQRRRIAAAYALRTGILQQQDVFVRTVIISSHHHAASQADVICKLGNSSATL
jgi:hypothetical protein